MKLAKHEHACFLLTSGAETLVVDPGDYTLPLSELDGVVGIVITHEHADHWTPEQLDRIIDRNPDARIFGPAGVVAAASGYPIEGVANGDTATVGSFELAFFGSKHAIIHESIPVIDNVGVLVNGVVYYAGDSYTVPPAPIDTLAVPIGAPWLKIGDVMDYLAEVKPKRAFATHEMLLSVIGKNSAHARVDGVVTANGGQYFRLEPGDSLDI